ncbi:MAG: peroxiredoxin [Synergistaceae bacterium]|jgi:peroxiredoxin (alkyl hydroperoxide reductase subunit C)|nr:peroxiredoxin [Synergistaceae bacterium]
MENCCESARIGKPAPNFEVDGFDALNGRFDKYSLANYKNKYVVLFFYPADYTYVCPTELIYLAKLKDQFDKSGVSVLVVSTDKKFTHKAWNEAELSQAFGGNYPYPMLADVLGNVGKPYGIYDEESGVDLRGIVLIDKQGVVQSITINSDPLGRNPKEILRVVLALIEHDNSGGKVIPACWIPGDDVIDPSYDNSGKVWTNYSKVLQKDPGQSGNWIS